MYRKKVRELSLLVVFVLSLVMSGCGSSDDSATNAEADVSGIWQVSGKNNTDGTDVDGRVCLLQTGNTICGFYYNPETPENFSNIVGNINGTTLDLTLTDENQTYLDLIVKTQNISGVWDNDYGDTGTATLSPVSAPNAKFYGYYNIQQEDCEGSSSETILIAPIKNHNTLNTLYLPEEKTSYSYTFDEGQGQNSVSVSGNKITVNQTEDNGEWEEWEMTFSTDLNSFTINGRQLEYRCSMTEPSTFTVNGIRTSCNDDDDDDDHRKVFLVYFEDTDKYMIEGMIEDEENVVQSAYISGPGGVVNLVNSAGSTWWHEYGIFIEPEDLPQAWTMDIEYTDSSTETLTFEITDWELAQ